MENEEIKGEIPNKGKMQKNCSMSTVDDSGTVKELREEKRRLKEREEEDAAIREMQDKIEKEMGCVRNPQEEVNCRSIFVGNIDYACTKQEVKKHFQSCGIIDRVTIVTDKFSRPRGFAFVEFEEFEAADVALQLNKSILHGRQLTVLPKRANVSEMKQELPNPNGYGKVPRFTRPTHYKPYN